MKNVKILAYDDLTTLEDELNKWFNKGYHLTGGVSFSGGLCFAVVVRPF